MAELIPVQVKGNVGTIEDNLDAVEASIREKAAEYSAVVVTEDNIADGKKFLADIRKEKKTLDDERKAIKSRWMAPYDAFEKRAKQIIALYEEPVKVINDQLAAYEEKRREQKRQEIRKVYDLVKGGFSDWLPLERIYNPKWENATYTGKKIREDMELLFDQLKVSISTIESMRSEFEKDALGVLKETGSLQAAILEIHTLQKQKERFVEQARQEQAEAAAIREESKETLIQPAENAGIKAPAFGPQEGPFAAERRLVVSVRVGENDLGMLKEFLEMTNLEYEVMG